MTDAQITQLVTAITLAVVDALSIPEVAPVAEVPMSEPSAPKKAKKATKKAPKRTKAENSLLVKRINGRIANGTKAVRHSDATYEQMIEILATATAITPSGWVSTHNQIARKADQLALEIAAR